MQREVFLIKISFKHFLGGQNKNNLLQYHHNHLHLSYFPVIWRNIINILFKFVYHNNVTNSARIKQKDK